MKTMPIMSANSSNIQSANLMKKNISFKGKENYITRVLKDTGKDIAHGLEHGITGSLADGLKGTDSLSDNFRIALLPVTATIETGIRAPLALVKNIFTKLLS